MKKLITILAVMIVLVGAVFAVEPNDTKEASTGTAAIDVKATVGVFYPVFQMKIGETPSRAVDSENTGITFVSTEAVPIYDDTDDLVEDLLSTTPGTASLVFNLNQISKSRCNTAYTLTVTASDLVLVKSEAGAKVAINRNLYDAIDANGAAVNAVTVDEKFTKAGVAVAPAEIANPNTGRVVPTANGNILTATYNGAMVNANAGELTLGTATVSWTRNSDAKAGDYQARVILTVATV